MAGPLKKKRGGVKSQDTEEKNSNFWNLFSNVPTAITLEGLGVLGLNGPAIKRRTFFLLLP